MGKSLYKSLRNAFPNEGKDLVMFRMKNRSIMYSDHQVKQYFLCEDCERKYSKYGENIVSRECYRGEGKFKLLDKIKNVTRFVDVDDERWINPNIESDLNPNAYLYFAASIVWRASAGDWLGELDSYKNALGTKYEEQLRTYLLGESDFPRNLYLAVYVDSDSEIVPLMSFPVVAKKCGYHHHLFYIPGIKFSFVVGAGITDGVKKIYEVGKTKILFMEYSFKKHEDFSFFQKKAKYELNPKGRLAKELRSA